MAIVGVALMLGFSYSHSGFAFLLRTWRRASVTVHLFRQSLYLRGDAHLGVEAPGCIEFAMCGGCVAA
jgi:hypothetical protein